MKFSISTKILESYSHFLAFLINHLVQRVIKFRVICSNDRLEPELCDSVVKRSLSQSQILKGIQDKNTAVPRFFLMSFRDEMMSYKGEFKLVL